MQDQEVNLIEFEPVCTEFEANIVYFEVNEREFDCLNGIEELAMPKCEDSLSHTDF